MNSFKISYDEDIPSNSQEARIGGQALLPDYISWPENIRGEKLILIASIPCRWINDILETNYPSSKYISVFTTYNKDDYFLDVITYSGNIDERKNITSGYTKVIIHGMANERLESDLMVPSMKIKTLDRLASQDIYYGSKIGGCPDLLQNNELSIQNLDFCIQLYSGDFPSEYEDMFYLSDALGYLYIGYEKESNIAGLFFVQVT